MYITYNLRIISANKKFYTKYIGNSFEQMNHYLFIMCL